jgi:hypothetical protein
MQMPSLGHLSALPPSTIISHLEKIQFVFEFFILSKLHKTDEVIPEICMVFEAFKFYFKSAALTGSPGLYIEEPPALPPADPLETKLETGSTAE